MSANQRTNRTHGVLREPLRRLLVQPKRPQLLNNILMLAHKIRLRGGNAGATRARHRLLATTDTMSRCVNPRREWGGLLNHLQRTTLPSRKALVRVLPKEQPVELVMTNRSEQTTHSILTEKDHKTRPTKPKPQERSINSAASRTSTTAIHRDNSATTPST